jgi:hypothetical protein
MLFSQALSHDYSLDLVVISAYAYIRERENYMTKNNARTQYFVAQGLMKHIEEQIASTGHIAESIQFKHSTREMLDLLADLLQNTEIAIAWNRDDSFKKQA